MAETLYTEKEHAQWRGPTTSDKYNERIEKLYKDLVHLYNKVGLAEESVRLALQRVLKDHFSLAKTLEDLEDRILTLESDVNKITFRNDAMLDTARFDGSPYEVTEVDRLFSDVQHGLVTLPKVTSTSASKIHFMNNNGEAVLPSTFEAIVVGVSGTADNQAAFVDTNDPYLAFIPSSDVAWERNVVVNAADGDGAEVTMYVRLPLDLMMDSSSNVIQIHPFPIMGCELKEVAYTTQADITLSEDDNYTPLNSGAIHSSDPLAVGWIAPGGWSGDEINDCGPKAFYFDPTDITGLKITLRQKSYFVEDGKYVYSYGMSQLDVRYDKFLDTGKAIFQFTAPDATTISSVDNVLPQIWNVSEAELTDVYDYRVLWETAFDSGIYTTTAVPFSQRVWIEVTLNKTVGGGSPALSGLVVSYS